MHKSGIIHRDIKPDNFMFGLKENGREKTLCIIDFGMSKFFVDLGPYLTFFQVFIFMKLFPPSCHRHW